MGLQVPPLLPTTPTQPIDIYTPDELDSRISQSNYTPAPIPSPTTAVLASEQPHIALKPSAYADSVSSDKSTHGSIYW